MTEAELIRACQRGDEAAFEALIHLYEKKVYTLCRRMCANEQDALEAAQDAFLALWRGIGSFRSDAAFSTWLYRLTTNACIDHARREKRGAAGVSLDDEELGVTLADSAPSPEQELERRETQRLLREGVLALPEEYRRVLLLRESEQLSYAEIVQITGLELGTVKSRISRGRRLLRNYLAASGNFFNTSASKDTECNNNDKNDDRKEGSAT